MREMQAGQAGHTADQRQAQLNPADPFIVGASRGSRGVDVSPEQRRALGRLRDMGGRVRRHELALAPELLASLLRGRMVALSGDRAELTTLGALALAGPVPRVARGGARPR
jgi:hypothetical protein